jgi:hypothetical protein
VADLLVRRALGTFPQEENCSTGTRTSTEMKIVHLTEQDPMPVAAHLLGLRVPVLLGAEVSVSCECCVSSDRSLSASGLSLVQRSPTECGVSE